MSTSISIRTNIVLLTVKFELTVIFRRTLQAEFGQDTSSEYTITRIYQRFCDTGTVKDRQRSRRPSSTITEEKVDDVHDVCESKGNSLLQLLAQFHEQQHIESSLNISH